MLNNPDVCIIGSGAAGSFLINELKESGLSVVILETGDFDPDSEINSFISKLNIHKQNHLNYGFSQQVGGSTNLWAGRVAPFEDADFKEKKLIPDSGWPIDLKELIPFYNKASDIMGLPPYEYFLEARNNPDHKHVKKIINAVYFSALDIKKFIWSSPPFNTRKTILKDVLENKYDDIKLHHDCHVTQLIENKDKSKIVAIEYIDQSGVAQKIAPKHTVLAAGGVENVRILLNSKEESPNGIANKEDVVGRYFSTHPKADMGVLLLNKSVPLKDALFLDTHDNNLSSRHGIGIDQETQLKDGYLNHYVQLTPMLEYTASTLFEKVKNSSALNSQLINKSNLLRGFLPGLGLIIFEIIGRLAGLQKKSTKFVLRAFLDQYPNKNNRIKLSEGTDKHGFSKVEIDWELTDKDKDSILKFFNFIDQSLQDSNIGHIEYSKLKELEHWPIIAIHSHFMGTTRMGADPKTSVVDKNCQAHGYSNLFIAGPSIFPTYGYANPVYTIAALSLRLGQFLKRSCRQQQ
jgi:choline dehydrogenase-like flavoprotein